MLIFVRVNLFKVKDNYVWNQVFTKIKTKLQKPGTQQNNESHVTLTAFVFIVFSVDSCKIAFDSSLYSSSSPARKLTLDFFFQNSDINSVVPLYSNDDQNFESTLYQWWALGSVRLESQNLSRMLEKAS